MGINIIMNAKKHETYILNKLSYLHLLPSNEVKMLAKKALAIINKHIKE